MGAGEIAQPRLRTLQDFVREQPGRRTNQIRGQTYPRIPPAENVDLLYGRAARTGPTTTAILNYDYRAETTDAYVFKCFCISCCMAENFHPEQNTNIIRIRFVSAVGRLLVQPISLQQYRPHDIHVHAKSHCPMGPGCLEICDIS